MNVSLHDAVVDALPYIDTGYDEPGVREAVSRGVWGGGGGGGLCVRDRFKLG